MHRALPATALLLLTAASLTACGGSDDTTSAAASTPPSTATPASVTTSTTTAMLTLALTNDVPASDSTSDCLSPSVYRRGVWVVGPQLQATGSGTVTMLGVTTGGAVGADHAALLHVDPAKVDPSFETSAGSLARYLPRGVWAHRSAITKAGAATLDAGQEGVLAFHLALQSDGESAELQTIGIRYTNGTDHTPVVARPTSGTQTVKLDSTC